MYKYLSKIGKIIIPIKSLMIEFIYLKKCGDIQCLWYEVSILARCQFFRVRLHDKTITKNQLFKLNSCQKSHTIRNIFCISAIMLWSFINFEELS